MIRNSLVYIYEPAPTKRFVGCGALIEGGFIATCRHVWALASAGNSDVEPAVLYPFAQSARSAVKLVDPCDETDGTSIDLVLLQPAFVPSGVLAQLAVEEVLEIGPASALAGLTGRDPQRPELIRDAMVPGEINRHRAADGLRQFTGSNRETYWFTWGSSGSPVFLTLGQQLAGIVTLSELGRNEGANVPREAFVLPATSIRPHVSRLVARRAAEARDLDLVTLKPVLDAIGASDAPLAEIPERLQQFVEAAQARAAEPAPRSNLGADIAAAIGTAREKLGALDPAGAIAVLQTKIGEESRAHIRRLLPLLRERAAVERLSFDYDTAKVTLAEITRLDPDDVGAWIDLGDLWRTTGVLEKAILTFREAEAASRRTGHERDLSISHNRIGLVREAQGDLDGALDAYRADLAIAERLAGRDASSALWQRDLSISHDRIGDVRQAQGDLDRALDAYRASFAIRERLAARDGDNSLWQRDLSVSHNKIGDVRRAQGDLDGALAAYRAALAIRKRLVARDAGNAEWQRHLSVSHDRIGDVRQAKGDLDGALAAYRASLAITECLVARDADNAEWQRDLSVSHNKIGDVRQAQGDPDEALDSYRTSLSIRERLAAQDVGNAEWQRDLSVSHNKIGDMRQGQGDLAGAFAAYRDSLEIRKRLANQDAGNAQWQRDLSISHDKIGDVLRAQGDLHGALDAYRDSLAIRERLAAKDTRNAEWHRDLIISHFNMSETAPAQARVYLTRALEIAQDLEATGRLAPVDSWMPDELRRRIAALGDG